MARTPRPSLSLPVPASLAEANTVLFRLGEIDRSVEDIERAFAEQVAALRQEADLALAPFATEATNLAKGFEVFAESNRATLLEGDAKSVTLSGGRFGWRYTPLRVSTGRGGDAKALATVQALNLKEYIRIEESLDKEALLRDRPAITGIKYTQVEKFFIEPEASVNDPEAATNVVRLVA